MISKGLMSSNSNEWETPQALFDELDAEFHFTLDPCARPENAKCERYFTPVEDGLSKSWRGQTVFMNPPYGREIGNWVEKAYREAGVDFVGNVMFFERQINTIVVGLIPARTDTKYWHNYIHGKAKVRFIRGRLKFKQNGKTHKSAPFPSAIVIWR